MLNLLSIRLSSFPTLISYRKYKYAQYDNFNKSSAISKTATSESLTVTNKPTKIVVLSVKVLTSKTMFEQDIYKAERKDHWNHNLFTGTQPTEVILD